MGPVGPLEATFALAGPIPAGNWHFVGDGVILLSVDMKFDVLWRSTAGDQPIVSWAQHFDVPAGSAALLAVPYEVDGAGAAVPSKAGDLLVLRLTASNTTGPAFIPNGDGSKTHGRMPSLTLPQ